MKKALSIVVALSLVLGSGIPAYATKTPPKIVAKVTQKGVIKSFTGKSITVLESGKTNTYSIDSKTKVTCGGEKTDILDAAKKGLVANYTTKGKVITSIEIEVSAGETIGDLGLGVVSNCVGSSEGTIVLADAKNEIKLDDNGLMNGYSVIVSEGQEIQDTQFSYVDKNKVDIGDIKITPGSLKVTFDGKQLKVIEDAKKEFDSTDKTDEVKLILTKTKYSLEFEAPLTDAKDDLSEDELSKLKEKLDQTLKLQYKRREFKVDRNELVSFRINEDVCAELNGKETTFVKALYRGNFFIVRNNSKNEVAFVDAYYKNVTCKLLSYDKKTNSLSISVLKSDQPIFKDVVKIASSVEFKNQDGTLSNLQNALKAKKVKLSVEPAENYQVVSIEIVK